MANLFPSIFPYAPDSPEMKKLGFQTEFEVYTKLGSIYDETVDILCEPKFIKRDYFGRMRDGEYTDFIILHPQKGLVFLECKGELVTYNAKEKLPQIEPAINQNCKIQIMNLKELKEKDKEKLKRHEIELSDEDNRIV